MPKVSQEHRDSRKAQILDAARRVFAEHGYDGATVKRLEEATGLSRGAIFHYFENKNELFVELAMETNTRFGDILLESGLDDAFRALAQESPEWLAVLIETESRMRHDEDFVRRLEAKATGASPRLQNWFKDEQEAGRLRSDLSSVEIGRFVTSLLNGLALRVASGDPFDLETIIVLMNDAIRPRALARPGNV